MFINEASIFPGGVDRMTFFQDVDLDHKEAMDEYNSLIANGQYTDASLLAANTKGLHGYFANLFNAYENRIYATQEYIRNIEKENPFIATDEYDDEGEEIEPEITSETSLNTIWI